MKKTNPLVSRSLAPSFGRLAVSSVLIGGALLLHPTTAHAGSLSLSVNYNGTSQGGKGLGAQKEMDSTKPWFTYDDNCDDSQHFAAAPAPDVTLSPTTSGNYILNVLWTPSGPTDQLPPTVIVKYRHIGHAFGYVGYPNPNTTTSQSIGSVTLDISIDQPDTPSSGGGATTQSVVGGGGGGGNEGDPSQGRSGPLKGKIVTRTFATGDIFFSSYLDVTDDIIEPYRLLTLSSKDASSAGNGKYKWTKNLPHVEVKATAKGGSAYDPNADFGEHIRGDGTRTEGNISIQYSGDTRSVKLMRGITPKLWNDPTLNKDHDEWAEVDSSGSWTTHGQSRWSYTNRVADGTKDLMNNPNFSDKPVPVTQVIGAQMGGSWSSYSLLQGVWSNPDPHDFFPPGTTGQPASQTHVENLPDGGSLEDDAGINASNSVYRSSRPQGWYGTPSKGQNPVIVTYTLTDKGPTPATATAKYILQLHDEWENVAPDSAYSWQEGGTGISHSGESLQWWQQALHYNGPQLTTASADASWDVTVDTKLSTKLSTTFALDFKLADWVKIGGSAEATAEASIDANFKASAPKPSAIFTVAPGDTFQPAIKYQVKTAHWLVDHFLLGGFDPNPDRSFGRVADKKWPQTGDIGVAQWVPYWIQIPVGKGPSTGLPYPPPTPTPVPSPTPTAKIQSNSPSTNSS